jgi:hypothetical protein
MIEGTVGSSSSKCSTRRRRNGKRANISGHMEGAQEAFGIWRTWGSRQVESGGDGGGGDVGGGVVVVVVVVWWW